jgi:hypothetical protein
MSWTIAITYETGDSFGNETIYDEEVGYAWDTEEGAEAALEAIEAHYNKYLDGDRSYSFDVTGNDGKKQTIHAFWCGYFERLEEAKIVKPTKVFRPVHI